MKPIWKRAFTIVLCLVLMSAWPYASARGEPKELTVAVGLALAPYNIPEENRGIELDIVRESLAMKGYRIKTKYVPFARRIREIAQGEVDGVLTVNENSDLDVYLSDQHIVCENVAVSLKKNNFKIEKISDLKDKSILTFQNAKKYLGKEFVAAAEASPDYREISGQELQINLLYGDRVDVIVLDKRIFYYHRKNNKMVDTTQPIDMFYIFEKVPFRVGFVDKKVRDDFNEGLKKLRESGRYDEIINKYILK
ncbi:MAG: transporter substrate-binding domain-containing protein [Deltaproteobacteria bacterium]|nr:transporter substrate-binding domain-containing protein [Deltaproteobacteria bacterium]